ncbi:GTPase IMAP family member 7-like isoform X2 [Perca fluviatilis]|uniref:GTPase IMAP family member 7-like isoform X2 n=1 Tax=Perca fluviatilis TaxID=8168 RepID=UPI0019634E24|nr:GTPase IMAP family member 7-like isoform X2 [Perca fluviatilis]
MSCFSKKEADILLPAELRIVLLGMVGVGKSSSGNTILGQENLFDSKPGLSAVTEKCQKKMGNINNQNVVVVDTPGLLNIDKTEEEIMREIKTSIKLAEPGPHVFLIVLSVRDKYTKKEEDMVRSIRDTFGKNTMDYTMVLFTHGEEGTIKDFFRGNENLHSLIKKCKYGYHLLDKPEQVPELLKKINDKVQAAEGRYYTAEMLQEAETALQQQVQNGPEGGTQPNQAAIQTTVFSGMGVGCLFGYLAGEGQITSTIGAALGAVGGGLLCAAVACVVILAKKKCKCSNTCCCLV